MSPLGALPQPALAKQDRQAALFRLHSYKQDRDICGCNSLAPIAHLPLNEQKDDKKSGTVAGFLDILRPKQPVGTCIFLLSRFIFKVLWHGATAFM